MGEGSASEPFTDSENAGGRTCVYRVLAANAHGSSSQYDFDGLRMGPVIGYGGSLGPAQALRRPSGRDGLPGQQERPAGMGKVSGVSVAPPPIRKRFVNRQRGELCKHTQQRPEDPGGVHTAWNALAGAFPNHPGA